jgi:NADH-quinone oxidoreductase subunit H
MRGAVQLISYEISLGLCLITAVALTGTMQISGIVDAQAKPFGWLIIQGHIPAIIAFLVFLVAGNAEANRGPFDLAEAESELTAGYHTEYSGMGFGFFYLAEFLNMFIIAGVATTVFLGGWMPIHIGVAGFDQIMDYIPGFIWFFAKAFGIVWIMMWIKWTYPRLRIDQLLSLEWKYLMPLSLFNLVLMTVIVAFGWHF